MLVSVAKVVIKNEEWRMMNEELRMNNGEQQEQQQEKDARRETPVADDLQRHIPARLRQIADASGGRIVIGSVPSRTDDDSPSKKIKL